MVHGNVKTDGSPICPSERLMRLLTMLGEDVEITVKAKPRNRAHGRIRVIDAAHV